MEDLELIGLGMLGIGILLFLVGILMLLDRALLVMSNILILTAILILMRPAGFYGFITERGRGQGTIAFFLGIALVLCKLPLPGLICEVTGAFWLFGGFWPLLMSLIAKLPYVANLFPVIAKFKDEGLPL